MGLCGGFGADAYRLRMLLFRSGREELIFPGSELTLLERGSGFGGAAKKSPSMSFVDFAGCAGAAGAGVEKSSTSKRFCWRGGGAAGGC